MKKMILLALLMKITCANAQTGFTNTGNFQIYSGTAVTGFSNFTNSASANLINNGDLYFKKTITNFYSD